jgi:hypothetical protein
VQRRLGSMHSRTLQRSLTDQQHAKQHTARRWEDRGYFKPKADASAEPFVISMPPPNVTGKLHMGHAMFATLQVGPDPQPSCQPPAKPCHAAAPGRCRAAPSTPSAAAVCKCRLHLCG